MFLDHVLTIQLLESRHLGPEPQALQLVATVAGETNSAGFIAGLQPHNISATLRWTLGRAAMKQLTASGVHQCKLSCHKQDGSRLGWVMLDLRQAKGNAQLSKKVYHGDWMPLLGASVSRSAEVPQLKIRYMFEEDRPPAAAPSPPKPAATPAAAEQAEQPPAPAGLASSKHSVEQAPGTTPSPALQLGSYDAPGSPAASSQGLLQLQQVPAMALVATPSTDAPAAGVVTSAVAAQSATQHEAPQQQPEQPPGMQAAMPAGPHSGLNATQDGMQPLEQHVPLPQASHTPDGTQVTGPAAALGGPVAGPVRRFNFKLELRSLHASLKLPLGILHAYVVVMLPPALAGLMDAAKPSTQKQVQLRSHPAVELTKGSECPLPNGTLTVELTAGVMELAALLAKNPHITLEVWHKERLRADLLLGVGSIPLSQLLQECWVEGYVPVYGSKSRPKPGSDMKTEVGQVRVVYFLEDLGPTPTGPAVAALAPPLVLQPAGVVSTSNGVGSGPAAPAESAPLSPLQNAAAVPALEQHTPTANILQQHTPPIQVQIPRHTLGSLAAAPAAPQHSTAVVPAAGLATPPTAASFREMPEFEAAWELELWKKGEEAKFREQLRAKERQRMEILEGEWLRREKAREAEVATLREEFTRLEENTQQALAAVEERERKLVVAEETLARRRKELERDHAARLTEAEAAVRRLQAECEHQLEMERDRNAELSRQRKSLEERLATAETGARTVEQAFAVFREQLSSSSQAQLQRDLLEARDQASRAAGKAARAKRAKKQYKKQMVKLAHELGALYKDHQALQFMLHQMRPAAPWQEPSDPLLAGMKSMQLGPPQQNLSQLREQLHLLRASMLPSSTTADHMTATVAATSNPRLSSLQAQAGLGSTASQRGEHGDGSTSDSSGQEDQPDSARPEYPSQPEREVLPQANSTQAMGTDTNNVPGLPSVAICNQAAAAPQTAPTANAAEVGPTATTVQDGFGDAGAGAVVREGLQSMLVQVRRLLKDKAELLASGAYDERDPVIQQLDVRIQQLVEASAP